MRHEIWNQRLGREDTITLLVVSNDRVITDRNITASAALINIQVQWSSSALHNFYPEPVLIKVEHFGSWSWSIKAWTRGFLLSLFYGSKWDKTKDLDDYVIVDNYKSPVRIEDHGNTNANGMESESLPLSTNIVWVNNSTSGKRDPTKCLL